MNKTRNHRAIIKITWRGFKFLKKEKENEKANVSQLFTNFLPIQVLMLEYIPSIGINYMKKTKELRDFRRTQRGTIRTFASFGGATLASVWNLPSLPLENLASLTHTLPSDYTSLSSISIALSGKIGPWGARIALFIINNDKRMGPD